MDEAIDLIKVSGTSNVQDTASVIARAVQNGGRPEVRAIGASAVNQAAKACAVACGYTAPRGLHLTYSIGFSDVEGDSGKPISAITFRPIVR